MKPLQFFNRVKMKVAIIPGNGAGDVFHANWYGWAHKQINKMENVSCDLRNMPDPSPPKSPYGSHSCVKKWSVTRTPSS